MSGSPIDRQRVWQQRWQEKEGSSFEWHMDEVPAQLARVVDEVALPVGAVVDLGCGAGVATAYLAERQPLTVGLDIALGAVTEARARVRAAGASASFVVADAARLPFRPASVALYFDRGCLQNLPEPDWDGYFRETSHSLKPGGVLQVLCSRSVAPALLSTSGMRKQAKRILGRGGKGGGPQFLTHALLQKLALGRVQTVEMDDFPYETKTAHRRIFTHCIFRREP